MAKGMAKVQKGPGNNVFIYIPAKIRNALGLKAGMEVEFDMGLSNPNVVPPRAGLFKKKTAPATQVIEVPQ